MPIQKPNLIDIAGDDLLRNSPARINSNSKALKATIDALVDAVTVLAAAQGLRVDLYNDGYTQRAPVSEVPNGLYFRIGPVPPGDALSRDSWIQTVD
jgi:hypothetical protein